SIIDFEARLDPDRGAEVFYDGGDRDDHQLNVTSIGGFALGCDPLDNPDEDPAISSTASSDSIVPQVVELVKDGPREAVGIGPSFPNIYSLYVDVAAGETLDDLVIADAIPDGLVYVPNSIQIQYRNGAVVDGLQISQPHGDTDDGSGNFSYSQAQLDGFRDNDTPNQSGGDLAISFDSFTAADNVDANGDYDSNLENDFNSRLASRSGGEFGNGDNSVLSNHPRVADRVRNDNWDIYITYEAYAPEFSSEGVAGADGLVAGTNTDEVFNDASLTAVHNGNVVVDNDTHLIGHDEDRRDADGTSATPGGAGAGKGVSAIYDEEGNQVNRAGGQAIPGDIVEFQIEFEMSDFIALDNLTIEDFMGDGLEYFTDAGLQVNGGGGHNSIDNISTFQSYIAIQSKGIGDDSVILGEFDQSNGDVLSVVPFGDPETFN
ncbi:MAG: hypothetical protein AAF226_17770, partial [Verrucomicrobiota bacterium]